MSEPLLKKRCQDGKKVSGASESEGIFAPQGLSHFFVTCFMFLLFLVEDDKCLNDSSQSYMAVFKYLENSHLIISSLSLSTIQDRCCCMKVNT